MGYAAMVWRRLEPKGRNGYVAGTRRCTTFLSHGQLPVKRRLFRVKDSGHLQNATEGSKIAKASCT